MTTELQSVRNLAATLRRQAEAQAERDAPLARCLTAWRASFDARSAPVVAEGERAKQPAYVARVSAQALQAHAASLEAECSLVIELAKHCGALDIELSTLRRAMIDHLAVVEAGLTTLAPTPQPAATAYR